MSQVERKAERHIEPRAIYSALDERDLAILRALLEHKVLTTHQLHVLFFRSLRRCQHRLSELKTLQLIACFQPRSGFGQGRSPEHHFLTVPGVSVLARRQGVPRGQLPWVPDETYEQNKNLRHRMGVNAFFCALVEASRLNQGHCLHRWVPERKVRTRAGEIQPDGFGRYLHPGGACQFYLEYDRATEGPAALTQKLRGYLTFARGWGEGASFPNVLVVVPHEPREAEVAAALATAYGGRRRAKVPVFLTSEGLMGALGVLGAVWLPPGSEEGRRCVTQLPAIDATSFDRRLCLGRYWTDGEWSSVSSLSATLRFPPGSPRPRE